MNLKSDNRKLYIYATLIDCNEKDIPARFVLRRLK
jgi:hypothetical protein